MRALKIIGGNIVVFTLLMAVIRYVFDGNLDTWNYYRTAFIGAALGIYRFWKITKAEKENGNT